MKDKVIKDSLIELIKVINKLNLAIPDNSKSEVDFHLQHNIGSIIFDTIGLPRDYDYSESYSDFYNSFSYEEKSFIDKEDIMPDDLSGDMKYIMGNAFYRDYFSEELDSLIELSNPDLLREKSISFIEEVEDYVKLNYPVLLYGGVDFDEVDDFGFYYTRGITKEGFSSNGKDIDFEEINDVVEFIYFNFEEKELIEKSFSSYYLKHVVEREIGRYVSNGELIVAMIRCGFEFKKEDNTPNAFFNVSRSSVKEAMNCELK